MVRLSILYLQKHAMIFFSSVILFNHLGPGHKICFDTVSVLVSKASEVALLPNSSKNNMTFHNF